MILGKTVDDLRLQTQIQEKYFPLIGTGLAQLMGKSPEKISVSRLMLSGREADEAQAILTVREGARYHVTGDNFELDGRVGELLESPEISLLVSDIQAKPGTRFILTSFSRLKAITLLQEAFSVADQGKDTGMLGLALTGEDPELTRQILNAISNNYLAQNVARQAAQDEKRLEFLNNQLPKVRSDLNTAEDKLNAYRKQQDSVDLNMEAKSVLDQIVNVDNQLNELTFREAEVSQLYKKDHPTYRALLEKRETLLNERTKLNKRVSSMPTTQQEVLRLSRDVESGRIVYLQLLNRQQELNIAKSSAIGNVRIIDDAVIQLKPVKPKKALVVLIGFIVGILASIGVVLLRIVLRQGVGTPEQLEAKGINVYACVPHSTWLDKKNALKKKSATDILLTLDNPADIAVEAIRSLRTSMHFAMLEAKNNVLMISGMTPGSGKTFISTNLSVIIAQTNKKVLFIDADMRRGYTHDLFGNINSAGLSGVLSGTCPMEQAIITLPSLGIDYIARGNIPPNPAELLMHPRFEALINEVSKRYDHIIIDTPPILAVTDPTIVGRYAGTVLLVAKFEVNTLKEITTAIRRFEQSGVNIKGCILNGIKRNKNTYYYSGYCI